MVRPGRRRDHDPRAARRAGGSGALSRLRDGTAAGWRSAVALLLAASAVAVGQGPAAAQPPADTSTARQPAGPDAALERLRAEADAVRALPLDTLAPEAARALADALREAERRSATADTDGLREALRRVRSALARIVEADVLGSPRRDSAGARRAEAHELAPRSWTEATGLLDRAEARLDAAVAAALGAESDGADGTRTAAGPAPDGGRSALDRARGVAGPAADSAARAFRFAWRLAFLADSIREHGPALEAYVLQRDSLVALTAAAAGVVSTPYDGPANDLSAVRSELRRRADSTDVLADRVARLEEALAATRDRGDSLATVLDSVEGRLAEVASELDRRLRRESRLREVKALFGGEEGSVIATDDSVVIRLTGLTFPPGEAELPDDAGPLLVKLRSVIRAFPEATIRVEGHTDARGNAEQNRVLSQRRAIAVREHLLLNLPISADRITAVGRGEAEPVASNDSEEGRARNRRIDVVLELGG